MRNKIIRFIRKIVGRDKMCILILNGHNYTDIYVNGERVNKGKPLENKKEFTYSFWI